MKTIKYEIEFFSNWHCGSGLAAGADVDALVIKDKQGMPYIPGRTMKGLLRDAASNLHDNDIDKGKVIDAIFGVSGDKEGHRTGSAFFSNAVLRPVEYEYILANGLTEYLFQSFASTSIDENGIARNATLRKIETVVPCKLVGEIINVPEDEDAKRMLEDSMHYIKRLGTGRNRGYGRCDITITEVINEKEA